MLFEGLTDAAINKGLFNQFRFINSVDERLCLSDTGYNIFEFQALHKYIMNDKTIFKCAIHQIEQKVNP